MKPLLPVKVRKDNDKKRKLSRKEMFSLRINYCAGVEPVKRIAEKHHISQSRLRGLAKRLDWKRDKGVRDETITSDKILYVGPLTLEEREKVARASASILKDVVEQHKEATRKALFLANQILDRLVANDGQKEVTLIPKGTTEPIKIRVSGTDELLAVAQVLAKIIPLDRVSAGLDPYKGEAGKRDNELRDKERDETFVRDMRQHFENRLLLAHSATAEQNAKLNGNDAPSLVLPPS